MQAECMIMKTEHQTVMLEEALTGLNIQPNGIYLDATYGRGGHSRGILKHLNSSGKLLVMDKDPLAVADARNLAHSDARISVFSGSFREISTFCNQEGVIGKVNGILFDLGVSSPQLDQADRGFSFMRAGALDMRMDPTSGISVAEWLASASAEQIAWVLKHYGEERFSQRIANAIVATRDQNPITTTVQLAEVISKAMPVKDKHKHPATRSFQALRIYINNELDELTAALDQMLQVLTAHGRLVVISFHSLEDRIVKQYIAQHAKGDDLPRLLPIKHADLQAPRLRKVGKALKPTDAEVRSNVRARSAILRVAEKLPEAANA
ncbi:MAG TPA: 16S rRNA (cytosine(1402)-N(4))-methyltransferase RsmH [Gammaproteobacteria bacterium]|nr:16S rRNA (cytosine(1402)-N(4))-methyltransferase RsmH [Gammaproteobacteria bacterium]